MPKKTALNLSIVIILFYWAYQLFVAKHDAALPDNFTDLALKIAFVKSIHLTAILLLLRIQGEKWIEMGFVSKNWKKQLLFGLLVGLIMFLVINVALSSFLGGMFPKKEGSSNILVYFQDHKNLFIWLVIGIFGVGFVEELMRIFMLTRFEKRFGQYGLYFALAFSSLVFGLGHLYQSTGTAISTGISGLVFGVLYIKRRSAIEVITIHAFSDVLAILGAYQLASQ